ncbi:MAG: response regulator [Cyanobacteriota bacterium]|nr:response regulator [Cyanobacteriota bacterium]
MKAKFLPGDFDDCLGKKPCILAVDDDEDNLALMAYITESLNYQLITAREGYKAFSLAKEKQPDLIVVEMVLPGMKGTTLISKLKQDPLTQAIPIIVVTGLAFDRGGNNNIRPPDCELYIRKPYLLEELEAAFRQVLQSKPDTTWEE